MRRERRVWGYGRRDGSEGRGRGVVVSLDWTGPLVRAVGPAEGVGLVRGAVGVGLLPNKSPQPTALSWCFAREELLATVIIGGGTLRGSGGG